MSRKRVVVSWTSHLAISCPSGTLIPSTTPSCSSGSTISVRLVAGPGWAESPRGWLPVLLLLLPAPPARPATASSHLLWGDSTRRRPALESSAPRPRCTLCRLDRPPRRIGHGALHAALRG